MHELELRDAESPDAEEALLFQRRVCNAESVRFNQDTQYYLLCEVSTASHYHSYCYRQPRCHVPYGAIVESFSLISDKAEAG